MTALDDKINEHFSGLVVRKDLVKRGYKLDFKEKNSGPITAIYFDREHGTFQGGASNTADDYGVAW